MKNYLSMAFFAAGAVWVGMDLTEYYRIQHELQAASLVPLLLLGILGHFAFERRTPAP